MRPSIENIVNVKGGGNWEFQLIAIHMGMDEENHVLVHSALIHELKIIRVTICRYFVR